MKKVIGIAIAFVAFVAIYLSLRNTDKVFPNVYPGVMPESIPVSYEMPLNFSLYREYKRERVTANIYSEDSVEKGEVLESFSLAFDEKNDSISEVRFVWNTPAEPGSYVVEYYSGYASGGQWYDSEEPAYFYFDVVYPCQEHTFVENKDSIYGIKGTNSDCHNRGTGYKLCTMCGYEEAYELDYAHVYGNAMTVSNATCTSTGYKTYKCKDCDYVKVETTEADTDKHNIRAVEKVEATATRPGSVWFECTHCNYVEPYKAETPALFMEIDPSLYYEKPVSWAYDKKVFKSIKGYTFEPDAECDKAIAICLIYIANGVGVLPEDENPFTDVSEGNYFRDAAKWAYKFGIVEGDKFEPYKTCTRGMLIEYLWRMSGSPKVMYQHNFDDVPEDASYSDAVSWAVSEGIASGMDETSFDPDRNCTQAQVITFLYRVLYEEEAEE